MGVGDRDGEGMTAGRGHSSGPLGSVPMGTPEVTPRVRGRVLTYQLSSSTGEAGREGLQGAAPADGHNCAQEGPPPRWDQAE